MFERLEKRLLLSIGGLTISEILAVNDSLYPDENGEFSDWIEIHNPTDTQVSLDGWYLTDDDTYLTKWGFPDVALDPGEYLVVFASGKDRVGPDELHTNFQLDGDGEYLALVGPDGLDGVAVSYEYAPAFPRQYTDVSYGLPEDPAALELQGNGLAYWIPQQNDAQLMTAWTAVGFDDVSWDGFPEGPRVLITEAGTVADFAEIQNASAESVDTTGWVVAANNSIGREPDINRVHTTLWPLPDSMAPGEVLYRHDDPDENPGDPAYHDSYWGEVISWKTNGPGWVAIVDDAGNVVDFVVWGYSDAEIASLAVNVNGYDITATDAWFGESVAADGAREHSLQRQGDFDGDGKGDWAFVEGITMGQQNEALDIPFGGHRPPSIGFERNLPGLGGEIEIDVDDLMYDVNASLWMRLPFEVDSPGGFDSMELQIEYNDGFVAYLNGREVARRNAPESPVWNSTATGSVGDSWEFEQIDVSEFINLLQQGTNVLAIHALNAAETDGNFLIWPQLVVRGAEYFDLPTPGVPNGESFLGFVRDTQFSVDRGFFDVPFEVEITSETPGATIYYTLDGSEPYLDTDGVDPDDTHGQPYSGPVPITGTTTLRAAAFKPGYVAANIDTQTYLFLNDVVEQDGAGFPGNWGHNGADYEMDPFVVNAAPFFDGGNQAFDVQDALSAIPSLSLVMDQDNWFAGGGQGIYIQGENSPRPVSAELIYPDGTEGFQINSSVEIVGGSSPSRWKMDKLSMRLKFRRDVADPPDPEFRGDWGPPKLNFPLFGDSVLGNGATDSFDSIVVDARMNMTWPYGGGVTPEYQRSHAQYTRDQFAADIQDALGGYAPHGISAHLYINGLYWGLYRLHERPDEHFAAAYLGGEDDGYDALKHNENTVLHGSNQSYRAMHDIANAGLAGPAQYAAIGQYLDVPNFIDYMITNFYIGNTDWAHHNWYATHYAADETGRWRYHSWDAEHSMKELNDNVTGKDNGYGSPTFLHRRLSENAEYQILFADHLHRHFHNDGVLTPGNVKALYQIRLDEIDRAIVAESARWGDNQLDRTGITYLRSPHWTSERNRILDTYLVQRSAIVVNQTGLYPNVDAPTFNKHGGLVPSGFELNVHAPDGTLYYTLDGSDPRLPGGGVSGAAEIFTGDAISLTDTVTVKARALQNNEWSALNEAKFFIDRPATAENLVISELNYNPHQPTQAERDAGYDDNDDFEFVELYNTSDETIYLCGMRFTAGIDFDFADSHAETLDAGGHLVVARNPAAFEARYGSAVEVVGGYDTRLNNSGERIALNDRFDEPIVAFEYDDGNGWPGTADGKGASLELIDPAAVAEADPQRSAFLTDADNWRRSSEYGGSPGAAGEGPRGDVLVNEVFTHTDPPMIDTIELHNTTAAPIDIGGWFLSDSNNRYEKFRLPDIAIGPYGYVVFDENDFNPAGDLSLGIEPDALAAFALDGAHGDDVWLLEADAEGKLIRFVDHVEFPAAANGESFGRWPNGSGELYPMIEPTLDPAGENSGPRVGSVIISELQYNPANVPGADDLEFVEIFNTTAATVDLTEWRIRKGIDFEFPAGTLLGPHAALIVVPFDVSGAPGEDAGKLDDFCDHYRIDSDTAQILGGYRNVLDNGGERVQLQRPDEPPLEEPDFIPRLVEDEIRYLDHAPWPAGADGTGRSLSRVSGDDWGNDPANWIDATPSPGAVLASGEAEVVARHVFYHNSAAFGPDDDGTIAPDKTALLPGQTAMFDNYTSYALGINGVMVDIAGLPDGATLDRHDFEFRVGNDDGPNAWDEATLPTSITISSHAGYGGSARITLTWADGTIKNQWLQVKVLDTANTGLPSADVFYFGNAVGESGDSAADAKVNAADVFLTRNNPHNLLNPAPIEFRYDFNRDGRVNATDMLIARENQTHFLDALKLIAAPDEAVREEAAAESVKTEWLY